MRRMEGKGPEGNFSMQISGDHRGRQEDATHGPMQRTDHTTSPQMRTKQQKGVHPRHHFLKDSCGVMVLGDRTRHRAEGDI